MLFQKFIINNGHFMPSLLIEKNDKHFCTAGSNGLLMISVRVWGDLWSKEASNFDITGGAEEQDGKTEFLIWDLQHELKNGDRLRFSFQEGDASSRPPEVFRDKFERKDLPTTDPTWPPPEEEIAKFEARPLLNRDLAWRFSMNEAAPKVIRPEAGRQQLSFGLLWNNRRPERIRVSLHSTSLREALARVNGFDYVTEYVPLGSRFELHIGV